jgi:hypothetical protein
MKTYEEWRYSSTILDLGTRWRWVRLDRLTPEKRALGTHWIQGWEGPRVDLDAVVKIKKVKYPCNRPWRPIGLWDVEDPTFSRQSVHSWRCSCQPYTPAALYTPGIFVVLISVRGWRDPRAIVRLEGLGQLKRKISAQLVAHPFTALHRLASCPGS